MFMKVLFNVLFLFLTYGTGSAHPRKHVKNALRVPYSQAVKYTRLPKPKVTFHAKPSLDVQDLFEQEVGHTRSPPDLPSLADILSGKISLENGVSLNYEGCEIAVKAEGKEYTLDLTNPKCKDFVSFKTFFSKFVKEPDESTDRFLSLDKFDVEKISVNTDKKVVSFSAKSKEPFQFMLGVDLKVSGSLNLTFNYGDLTFKGLGLNIKGDIKIGGTTIKYSLAKKENSEEGAFSLTADSIVISDFYKSFTGDSELDDNDVGSKAFADAKVDKPTIKGTRDKGGNSELVLSATATGIPGLSKGSFIVIINAPYGKNAEVGVLVDLQEISPAEILTKLTAMDVSEVPVLSDLKINVLIEYANTVMSPKDPEALAMVKKYSKTGVINSGLKLKFEMPFEQILKKHGATLPPNTNLRPEITVMFKDGKVNFEIPPDAPMDIINIAIAFVPGFAKAALNKVFDEPPKIKVKKFEIDVKGSVDVELEAVGKIGFKMLSLDSLKFALKHKPKGSWDFTFDAVKMVGTIEMKLHVSKIGDEYHVTGNISSLTTSDIADTFSVDSTVGKAIKSLKSLNIALMDVKLEINFGELINAKFLAKLTFLGFEAIFEGYVVQVVPGDSAMAFGIVVTNVGVADLVYKMFKEDMAVIFANKKATEKVKFKDKSLQAAKKPTDLGVAFSADVAIPADCDKEQLCQLISKALGPGAHLILNGVVQNGKIELSAEFTGSIKIGDKLAIEKAGFMIKAGIESSPEFSIYGQATLDVQEEKGIVFKAKLGLTAAMTVSLTLTMENWLKNPFGIKYLEIGNFNLLAAINVITAVPSFSLSGSLRIGNPDKAIQADLAGGFDGTSGKFYVYAKFSKLTLKSTLEAFDMDPEKIAKIPPRISDSGFPEGFVAGIAMPTAVEIPHLNVKLEPGFFLKGKIVLIGYTVAAEVKVNFPSITVKAKFDKISLAGGIIQLTKVDDRNSGPEFELALAPKKLSIQINAYIESFGIGVGAEINITHERVFFHITGKFLNLFEQTLKFSAPFIGDLTKIAASEWELYGCIETHLDEIGKGAGTVAKKGANQVKEAEEDCKKIGDKAGSWFDKAQKKVEKAKKKLEKLEGKLNKQIEKAKKTRDKLKNSCAEQCDKELIWIGGLGEKDCQVTETTTMKCPIWIPKKKEVIDPKCIAKCNKGMLKKVGGWAKGKKAALIEKALQVFTKLLERSQAFLISAKRLSVNAEEAKAQLTEMAAKGKELVGKVANYVADKIIHIRKLCIKSTLKEGLCFTVDADITAAGQHFLLEKEEACFTTSWVKDTAKKIARRAFPSLGTIKEKFKQIKSLFSNSEKSQGDISKQEKDVEEADSEEVEDVDGDDDDDDDSRKRNLRSSDIVMANSRLIDRIGPVPEYVIRNAKSMRVFRDLFFNAEMDPIVMRSDIDTIGDTPNDTKPNFNIANILDTLALRRSNKCEKQKAILDLYRGIARSAEDLLNNNRETKRSIDNFTLTFENSFDKMEKEFLYDTQMNNMTDDQINDAMYYVNFGKQGIFNMKRRFDRQFSLMDKQSLRQWRSYIEKPFADTDSNLNSLHGLLRDSSFAASKRWTIPEVKEKINIADQIMQDLLRKDETALLTKQASIARLNSAVNEIVAVGLDPGCLTAVHEEA